MGFLHWRLWDRLDELDRRTGFRPDWTKRSATFMEIFVWGVTALLVVRAVVDLIRGEWAAGLVEGALAVIAGLWSLAHLRRTRRGISDERPQS